MSNVNDMNQLKGEEGIERYANGVANGILEYCGLENKGFGSVSSGISGNVKNNAKIDSKICDLRYVSKEKFEEDLDSGNEEVLYEFTLDENNKIMIATWSFTEDEGIKYKKKELQSTSTYTQKYTMPFEYLLAFYIETRNEEFIIDLADLAINSEYVLAIQDDVTTKKVEKFEQTILKTYEGSTENAPISVSEGAIKKVSSSISEYVSTKVELTYVDTWFVKFYKDISYGASELNSPTSQVNTVKPISGFVKISEYSNPTTYEEGHPGEKEGTIDFIVTKNTVNTNTFDYKYNSGNMNTLGNEQKFTNIYRKNKEFRLSLHPQLLYNIMKSQPKTSGMIDLTKYLLYIASGHDNRFDYGVTEFDFNIYKPSDFKRSGGIHGNTAAEKIWFGFRAAGYSKEAAAGVIGNAFQESSLHPWSVNCEWSKERQEQYIFNFENASEAEASRYFVDKQGFGLFGFTYHTIKDEIYHFAKSQGKSLSDPEIQVQYLLASLDPSSPVPGITYILTNNTHGCSREGWMSADTPEEAARQFLWIYENPTAGTENLEVRQKTAREYYEKFKDMPDYIMGEDSRIGPIKLLGENGEKMMEMLVFALRIADDDTYGYAYGAEHTGSYNWTKDYIPINFDCSSFVEYLYYTHFGLTLGGTTTGMHERYKSQAINLDKIEIDELEPGDVLLRPREGERDGHVGIYLGYGQYVHASNPATGIKVSPYNSSNFREAYRIIKD